MSKPAAPRNTRSDARRLFPTWSREQQARWVVARLRTESGRWSAPIGSKYQPADPGAPDFLRELPRDDYLEIVRDPYDIARDIKRYALRLVKGGK